MYIKKVTVACGQKRLIIHAWFSWGWRFHSIVFYDKRFGVMEPVPIVVMMEQSHVLVQHLQPLVAALESRQLHSEVRLRIDSKSSFPVSNLRRISLMVMSEVFGTAARFSISKHSPRCANTWVCSLSVRITFSSRLSQLVWEISEGKY